MIALRRTYATAFTIRALAAAGLALALIASAIGMAPGLSEGAFAEGYTVISIDGVKQFEIEALETAYDNAMEKVAEADAKVAENQAKIDELEKVLPAQQRRSDEAMRAIYTMQENRLLYLDVLLGAQSFDEFVKQVEYFDRANKSNLAELNKTKALLAELEEARVALDAAKAEADAQAELAHNALTTIQDERAEKQRSGIASALAQASGGGDSSVLIDGADWHMSEAEFVATWAPRIDAFFAGTPMAGTGEAFALASFHYCVDPRWSPAISNTESSRGLYCIRPYNAWGWGAADSDPYNLAFQWGSWEEAIDAHVRGLAEGYGYTISVSAAQKYCSSPDSWYANTLWAMAQI